MILEVGELVMFFLKRLNRKNFGIIEDKKNRKEDEIKVYVTNCGNKEHFLTLCAKVINENKEHHIYIRLRGETPKTDRLAKMLKQAKTKNISMSIIANGSCINPQIARLCKAYCKDVYLVWEQDDRVLEAIRFLHEYNVPINVLFHLNNATLDEANLRMYYGFMCSPSKICFVYNESEPINIDDMRARKLFSSIVALNAEKHNVRYDEKMMSLTTDAGMNNEGISLLEKEAMILEPA